MWYQSKATSMENKRYNTVQGNVRRRYESPIRMQKQKKRGMNKARDHAIGAASDGLTYEPPPHEVSHGEEGDSSASGRLDERVDLTEVVLAAFKLVSRSG